MKIHHKSHWNGRLEQSKYGFHITEMRYTLQKKGFGDPEFPAYRSWTEVHFLPHFPRENL